VADDATVEDQLSQRDWLVRAHNQASRDFDKLVITLSSGALAISLVFVHDVAPKPTSTGWLYIAWVLFALSLLLNLVSYLFSMAAINVYIAWIDKLKKPKVGEDGKDKDTWWTRSTAGLNLLSVAALVLGVLALLLFAGKNI
jgi:hypothetical protein